MITREPLNETDRFVTSDEIKFQTFTFVLSIIVQLAVFGFSLFTFLKPNVESSSLLNTVQVMEFVVQCVELGFYLTIALLLWSNPNIQRISLFWRYLDWVVTTPTMLVSVLLLITYFYSPCATIGDAVRSSSTSTSMSLSSSTSSSTSSSSGVDGKFFLYCVVIAIFDLLMLATGFVIEYTGTHNNFLQRLHLLVVNQNHGYTNRVVLLGFFFMVLAFLPLILEVDTRPSDEGILLVLLTFVVWSFYGVVTVVLKKEVNRNSAFNVLDVVSKNLTGVLVSVAVLTHHSSKDEHECS
jgi:bacteriorhodopsin